MNDLKLIADKLIHLEPFNLTEDILEEMADCIDLCDLSGTESIQYIIGVLLELFETHPMMTDEENNS